MFFEIDDRMGDDAVGLGRLPPKPRSYYQFSSSWAVPGFPETAIVAFASNLIKVARFFMPIILPNNRRIICANLNPDGPAEVPDATNTNECMVRAEPFPAAPFLKLHDITHSKLKCQELTCYWSW